MMQDTTAHFAVPTGAVLVCPLCPPMRRHVALWGCYLCGRGVCPEHLTSMALCMACAPTDSAE